MSNKYNKNLINYVSKYKVPKAANLEKGDYGSEVIPIKDFFHNN